MVYLFYFITFYFYFLIFGKFVKKGKGNWRNKSVFTLEQQFKAGENVIIVYGAE